MQDEASVGGPIVQESALTGHYGERLVDLAVTKMGLLFHDVSNTDFGIDGLIEITRASGNQQVASGRQVAVQVKAGNSIVKPTRYGYTYYASEAHARYWLSHSLPVILVYCDMATDRLRWTEVSSDTVRKTQKGYAVDIAENSDLTAAISELRKIAGAGSTPTANGSHMLLLPLDEQHGIPLSDEDLGLRALEAGAAAQRGAALTVAVEVIGEGELIAQIDAIHDRPNATADERRTALMQGSILDRYQRSAARLSREVSLMLTGNGFAEALGFGDTPVDDQWMATAMRNLAGNFQRPPRNREGIWIDAWPKAACQYPVVKFPIDAKLWEDSCTPLIDVSMRMGAHGGMTVLDLPREAFFTDFLPALANRLRQFADECKITDEDAVEKANMDPHFWMMGYG